MDKMTYKITYYNRFNEPYYNGSKQPYEHQNSEYWKVDSSETAMLIVKDFLDVPEGELTLDQIKADFAPGQSLPDISEEKYVAIQNYYNGRLAIWEKVKRDMAKPEVPRRGSPIVRRYDIPEKYNSFSMTDEETASQIAAYVEIEISLAE